MTSSHQDASSCQWFAYLSAALDRRSAARLTLLFLGALLARGRRTVTSWIRSAGLSQQFHPCYTTVAAAGKKAADIAARLLTTVVKPLVAGLPRITLALDDTPTQRYGPFVQGAGIHHNPTPGPANAPHVYGHIWVVLGLLTRGISIHSFRKRLYQAPTPKPAPANPRSADAAVHFVPVTILPDPIPATKSVPQPLELILASGRRIAVAPGFDPQTLRQLIAVVEERTCSD